MKIYQLDLNCYAVNTILWPRSNCSSTDKINEQLQYCLTIRQEYSKLSYQN